jgi:hypothetical protein
MLRRVATLAVLGFAILISACSDQSTQITEPADLPSLKQGAIGVNDIRAMIRALAPPGVRGQAEGAYGQLNGQIGTPGVEDAALAFQTVMLNLYDQGALVAPNGTTLDGAVLELMNTVFAFVGLPQYVVPVPPAGAEFALEILTNSDFDQNGKATIKTNKAGRAAFVVNLGSFNGPAILTVIEKSSLSQSYVFPLPPGITKIAEVFEMSASNRILPEGLIVSICDDLSVATNKLKWVLHDDGVQQFAVKITPNAVGHACPDVHASASFDGDGPLWARSLNAAGAFFGSVLLPKPAYASHSLAHAIIVDELSPYTVGEEDLGHTVRAVAVGSGGTFTDATVAFGLVNRFLVWLEISSNGVVQQCGTDLNAHDVTGQIAATSANPPVSAVVERGCSQVNGTNVWVFEVANPAWPAGSSGVIDVTVNGTAATPQLTYTATAPIIN